MALLFIDGFDHYQTSDISKKYQYTSSSPSILPTGGRMGGGCLLNDSYQDAVGRTIPTSTNVIVGAAILLTTGNQFLDNATGIFAMVSGVTLTSRLLYIAGRFYITNSLGTVLGTSSNITTFTKDTWNYIEWKMQISDSIPADTCIVRVNGLEVLNLPVGTDTRYSTDPLTIQSVRIGCGVSPYTHPMQVDDFYICDTTGSGPTDFLGDIRVDTLLPTLDGTYNDGVPSTGTDSWSILDNVPPIYTQYVSLTNTGEKETLQFGNLSPITSQTIYGIQVDLASSKSDAGAKIVAPLALSSSTLGEAANSALTTSYVFSTGIFTTDPNTSTAWDESGVNAAEFGIVIK